MTDEQHDFVIVSTADWDNPFWTNKQHVALSLAELGHRVFYIESQGLRAPTATARDMKRIFKRLWKAALPPKQVKPNLWVWSPLAIPLQKYAPVRLLNRILSSGGLKIWRTVLGLKPTILWTYSPLTLEFYDPSQYKLLVYHSVDDIKAQPGMPREVIEKSEIRLSTRADLIFVTAQNLFDYHSKLNPNTHYFSNVADYQHFGKALQPETQTPPDIEAIPGPRIGFVGAISGYKLDFNLIERVAKTRPDWSFILIGDVGEGDPYTNIEQLRSIPNVHLMGPRKYDSMPSYLKGFDVAILPSALNAYTTSMFPMKFFEYLAAGLPIVSTRLPALAAYSDYMEIADDALTFEACVDRALNSTPADLEKRLSLAAQNTYVSRTRKMMALVDAALQAKA